MIQIGARVRLLIHYEASGGCHMTKGSVFEVCAVYPGGQVGICHPLAGHEVLFTAREIEACPVSADAAKRADKRFWRVSAFALGETDIRSRCAIHKASRRVDMAESHFLNLSKQVGQKFGMVILHQGNLRRNAHRIYCRTNA